MSKRWCSAFLALLVIFGFTTTSTAASGNCGPDAMAQAIADCGFDFNCITRVSTEFSQRCTEQPAGQEPPPAATPPPVTPLDSPGGNQAQIPGMPQGMGEMLRQMQECQGNPDCLQNFQDQIPGNADREAQAGDADFDSTYRIGEQTILPSSWLQSYQEAIVNCGNNAGCQTSLFLGAGQSKINAVCGTNYMKPETAICKAVALNELHIEQAIALQRIASRTSSPDSGEPSQETAAETTSVADESSDATGLDANVGSMSFLPEVSRARVDQIVAQWKNRLENDLPEEGRRKITTAASAYPLENTEGTPPLVYEETETENDINIDVRPTSRDWAFALIAVLLTDAGLETGGTDGSLLLDHALWSLIQATELAPEASHYSHIGFHLNLRGRAKEARDILIYARKLDPENADTDNNLAYSYSALGKKDEAETLQQNAVRLDPTDPHLRSRLNAMLGMDDTFQSTAGGGDFGEAFYRLSKRHILREYKAGQEWQKQRDLAKDRVLGSTPRVPGPFAYYAKDIKDINEDYRACAKEAPKILRGCPHGTFILHPDCKDLPTEEQVARSRHNNNVHLCQCQNHYIQAKADAITAYLNAGIQDWNNYEEEWWPRLNGYRTHWSRDIREVNASYSQGSFQYPVQSAYWEWANEFAEDSKEFWNDDIQDIYDRWDALKSKAQSVKTCKTRLPPIEKKPKPKKKKKPEEKSTTYGINLIVVELKVGMNGDFKAAFNLGIVKGGYERNVNRDSHKVTIGSGSIDVAFTSGKTNSVSMTIGTNVAKFIPGVGAVAGKVISVGAQYKVTLDSHGKFSQTIKVNRKVNISYLVKSRPAYMRN